MKEADQFYATREVQLRRIENRLPKARELVQLEGGQSTVFFEDPTTHAKRTLVLTPRFIYGMMLARNSMMDDLA